MARKRKPYFVVRFRGDPAVSAHDTTLLISRKSWRRKNGKFVMTGLVENGGWNLTYRDGLIITGRGDPGREVRMTEIARVPESVHISSNNWDDALDWFHHLPLSKKSVVPSVVFPSERERRKDEVCSHCGR